MAKDTEKNYHDVQNNVQNNVQNDDVQRTSIDLTRYKSHETLNDPWDYPYARGSIICITHVVTKMSVRFKASLKSHSETYNVGWTDEKTYGRMDNIQKYSNTTRQIDFSLDIPAESEADAVMNLAAIGRLVQLQYPTYDTALGSRATTVNSPPLVRIKFGNIITKAGVSANAYDELSGLLGVIKSVKWNSDQKFGYFNPYPGEFYPRLIVLTISFTAIHEHALGWDPNSKALDDGFEYYPFGLKKEEE